MDDRKLRNGRTLPPCASLHPDDGVDSRDLFRKQSRSKAEHADRRLCGQVFDVLSLLLGGELTDPRLAGLFVDSVVPAPDASRLMVNLRLVPPANGPGPDPATVTAALESIRGLARCEVAAAISRKRAPELAFRLLGPATAPAQQITEEEDQA